MMNKLLTNDELKEMVYGTTDTSNSANSNNVTNPAPVDGMYCFFPRDAMHKRGISRSAVSVRPPRSFILSKRINVRIFKNFHR